MVVEYSCSNLLHNMLCNLEEASEQAISFGGGVRLPHKVTDVMTVGWIVWRVIR